MLLCLPRYAGASITRTRAAEYIDAADTVVDVGGVYDPAALRFDHHQRTFEGKWGDGDGERPDGKEAVTKLSSAGLVYKHMGREIIGLVAASHGVDADADTVDMVWRRTYSNFVEEIDAIDNGVEVADERRYTINTNLSARVGQLNPAWNEDQSDESANTRFRAAVSTTTTEFLRSVIGTLTVWLPARAIVAAAVEAAPSVHASGKLLRLESVCPWKAHLFDLEEAAGTPGRFIYALYQDTKGGWRIQSVPKSGPSAFDQRKPLPEPWRGVRDAALSELTGIEGGVFVHATGFIGGNATYEGALAMAEAALAFAE